MQTISKDQRTERVCDCAFRRSTRKIGKMVCKKQIHVFMDAIQRFNKQTSDTRVFILEAITRCSVR